jgi:hypothetical protein
MGCDRAFIEALIAPIGGKIVSTVDNGSSTGERGDYYGYGRNFEWIAEGPHPNWDDECYKLFKKHPKNGCGMACIYLGDVVTSPTLKMVFPNVQQARLFMDFITDPAIYSKFEEWQIAMSMDVLHPKQAPNNANTVKFQGVGKISNKSKSKS